VTCHGCHERGGGRLQFESLPGRRRLHSRGSERSAREARLSTALEPYRIRIPESDLEDLRERLRRTRWPEREPVGDWSQGVPLGYLRELCAYWATDYDWRATEARLNAIPQFRTTIDGIRIHFLHIRSPHPGALPIVLTHGWPGSVVEWLKVIGPLSDPPSYGSDAHDAFHLVCPTLPGYGFSDKPAEPGWGIERIAGAWAVLMSRLGYDRYGAVGSDWGTSISTLLGQLDDTHVAGIHLVPPLAPPDPATFPELTDAERASLERLEHAREWDSPGTRRSTRRGRRPSATRWSTRRWRSPRGSSRSSGRGPIMTAASRPS